MDKGSRKQVNKYLKFTGLAMQMGAIIGGGVWLGVVLDEKYNGGGRAWTVGCALFGVAAALYVVLKEVIRMTNDDQNE